MTKQLSDFTRHIHHMKLHEALRRCSLPPRPLLPPRSLTSVPSTSASPPFSQHKPPLLPIRAKLTPRTTTLLPLPKLWTPALPQSAINVLQVCKPTPEAAHAVVLHGALNCAPLHLNAAPSPNDGDARQLAPRNVHVRHLTHPTVPARDPAFALEPVMDTRLTVTLLPFPRLMTPQHPQHTSSQRSPKSQMAGSFANPSAHAAFRCLGAMLSRRKATTRRRCSHFRLLSRSSSDAKKAGRLGFSRHSLTWSWAAPESEQAPMHHAQKWQPQPPSPRAQCSAMQRDTSIDPGR